jgi:hypothetical protein
MHADLTPLTGPARPTDTTLLVAIAATHAYHVSQGWHATWSVTSVIRNLIDTMSDIDLKDLTDLNALAILKDPTRAMRLARHIDAMAAQTDQE